MENAEQNEEGKKGHTTVKEGEPGSSGSSRRNREGSSGQGGSLLVSCCERKDEQQEGSVNELAGEGNHERHRDSTSDSSHRRRDFQRA
ncbi:hypothetical protein R1flu_002624 [Riccia fluitans]|uniref:Uncharacterized protein n=1 Tax=Riccia fluitans TaxID=41844 RepID=A0ABD1Y7N4_9MARC